MRLFKILSETKVRILEKLLSSEECCSNLSKCLGKDISTVSRHLHELEAANILALKKDGKMLKCRVKQPDKVRKLIALGKELEKGA